MMVAQSHDSADRFDGVVGDLRFKEPMSQHTSWRVGGIADIYFVPDGIADLAHFMQNLPADMPVTMTGLGSNLLVRDGGLRGAVVCTHKGLSAIEQPDDTRVHAQAGVPGAKVARFSLKQGLRGAEFLAGIPGTVGGALAMNAGAFGGETWSIVESVDTVNRAGEINQRAPEDYDIAYRHVRGAQDEWFVAATFKLAAGDVEAGRGEIRDLLAKRGTSQPIQSANAGSVFRNPEGDFAARLIEDCGLKGHRIGGAEISQRHANFILNVDSAQASDIESLIELVIATVSERHDVELEPEVRIVGEAHS